MTDVTGGPVDDEPTLDEPGNSTDAADDTPAAPARRPSPGAQAASRARRIGGRPSPGPRPDRDDATDTTAARPARRGVDAPASATPGRSSRAAREARPPKSPRSTKPPVDAATTQRRLATVARALTLVATVAIVALLGVGLWLSHGVWWNKSSTNTHRNTVRQQVLAAAKTCTASILSYDYRTLDAAEKAGQACATGQLKSDYTELMDKTVKVIAPQTNVVQVFQVEKAGIQSVSPDGKQWVIVVYGQQQVTSKSITSGPRLDISNAIVTMNLVGRQWLISNMTTPS